MPPEPEATTRATVRFRPHVLRVSDRSAGWLAILLAATVVFTVQVVRPVGVPLYDGVVAQEPYRFLHPTGDQPGAPTSVSMDAEVTGSESPQFVAATTEVPPQAQLVALPGAFALPPGTTSLSVSVKAIDAPTEAPAGQIAGNVYQVSVTDQSGTPLVTRQCRGCISLVMRAPENATGEGRLQRYADGAWTAVETVHAGIFGMYSTNPTALGVYAIVMIPGGESPGVEGLAVAGGAVAILGLLFIAVLLLRRRGIRPAEAPTGAPSSTRSIPSKRKRANRTPSGRPEQ